MAKAKKSTPSPTSLPEEGHLAHLPARISPSRTKDYMQCPKLFYYKTIVGVSTPNTIATARGTLAHSAFELLFDHDKHERTLQNAVAYVRPAWEVMTNPFVSWESVEPGTPEDLLRTAAGAFLELLKPRTKNAKRAKESALDYKGILDREATERNLALTKNNPDAPPVTAADVEEELLSSAEQMVRNYFQMEKPEKFDPEGREVHVQATTLGVTLHGFIDRLDKYTTQDGTTRWFISDYKSLALDTPLVTPTGWTTMGEVQVGEMLLGPDGLPAVVTAKSQVHHRPTFRVEFDDHTSIVCSDDHLWQVTLHGGPAPEKVVIPTSELGNILAEGTLRAVITNTAPLVLEHQDLPQDPYLVGESLARTNFFPHDDSPVLPMPYLRSEASQRLELLRGLMDVAGSVEGDSYTFSTPHVKISTVVEDLLAGLGVTFVSTIERGQHQVYFTSPDLVPFRSVEHVLPTVMSEAQRQVTKVVPVLMVPTQCVSVDSMDHLYLAGLQMVPTHNTGKVPGEGKRYSPEVMRRIEEESFFAMKVYALLFFEMHKIVPDELRLLYVKTGDRHKGIKTLKVTPDMINSTRNQLAALWKGIKDNARKEEWPTKTGPLCNWCHFQEVCPAFNNGEAILLPEEIALQGGPPAESLPAPEAGPTR